MNTEHFKQKLETEKLSLEEELAVVEDKEPIETRDEVANKFEDSEERDSTNENLEARLKDVIDALAKITAGTYGVCEISGEAIETDRLEANPSARTCKKHISELNGHN